MSFGIKVVAVGAGIALLLGCAAPPAVTPLAASQLWQDEAFHYEAGRVKETRQTLFELDANAMAEIQTTDNKHHSTEQRLEQLLARLYGGSKGIRLTYASGHSTSASETWANKRGDCLSLTIMAYAAMRALGISTHMQEVRVPITVNRMDDLDFVSGHVNVFVPDRTSILVNNRTFDSSGLIIDFELQPGSKRIGQWLDEDEVLARFYNNRASEFLVKKDLDHAYAYYKAAIQTTPRYAPAYANLANLYSRRGLMGPAEQLLRHALLLQGDSYASLRSMQELMAAQGRSLEAQNFADRLRQLQDEDPYYWLGLGMDALQHAKYSEAINTLERAASLTTGFREIHYHLALAYLRDGQRDKAAKQIAVLDTMTHDDPGVALLNKKMQNMGAKSAVF